MYFWAVANIGHVCRDGPFLRPRRRLLRKIKEPRYAVSYSIVSKSYRLAYTPKLLAPGFAPGSFCWSSGRAVWFPILHDLNHDVLAPWAFERAPVVTGCVRLDADKPHIGIAELAARVRNYPPSRKYLKWSHASPSQRDFTRSCFYRFRSDRAFKKFNAPKFFVCPKADIARKSDA